MAISLSRTTSNGFVPDFPPSWSKEVGLIVHVVEARGLLSKDLFGKSNPFVVLKLWGQERVSHVIKNCLSPKWNQTFMFSLYSEKIADDELVITLWDKDSLFKNGFLGMVRIAMGPLMDNQTRDQWYPLEKRSSKSRVKGNIRLWTQLTTSSPKEPVPFHPLPTSFSMPSISTLDGASTSNSSDSQYARSKNGKVDTEPLGLYHTSSTPTTPTYGYTTTQRPVSNSLDEGDFLHIEPTRDEKGKGKGKDEAWFPRPPSPPKQLDSPLPTSHPSTQTHVYYDAFGDPVEDADMIAILKMEEEEKRNKEAEEERLFREYMSTLQRCSVCGADDGGDPLALPCDHTFCRNCLASHVSNHYSHLFGFDFDIVHIRSILKNKKHIHGGMSNITCPSCDGAIGEWAIKRALTSTEYETLLNQSLQLFIDSGTGVSSLFSSLLLESLTIQIFRCPASACGAPIERIPQNNKLILEHNHTNESVTEQHREEYRFRCRSCSTEFCSGCMVMPYHAGYTCEGYTRYMKSKHCRFCAATLDNIGPSAGTNDVCKSEECLEKAKLCCKKRNPCGHSCGGILDEQLCMPCLHCQEQSSAEQCSDDFCNICWVESLGSAPAVKLKCGHVFHYTCVKSKLKKKWPAARITFGFSECPLCKSTIEHPAFEEDLKPIRDLKAMVQQKASQRLEFEGLSKAKEITDPSSKFFNNRDRYAMDRYAYFMCAKCTQPYFAGQRRCDAGEEEKPFDPADLVCGACSGSAPQAECATHGKDFLEWKCQFCCTISAWYCWGKTHFCNDCHTKQQKGDYLTKKPKSAIPMCPGPDKCPLGIAHPHCEEFLLGCALCRNVRTF